MRKIICIVGVLLLSMPLLAQRLKVKTFGLPLDYKKHYSHIIDAASIDNSVHIFIGGNRTDKAGENVDVTGHKIFSTNLLSNKNAKTVNIEVDKILMTDFTVHPSSEFRYAVGTGIYYPDGVDDNGYPFLGLYDKGTFEIRYFYYYNLAYPVEDTTHAVGLRVEYSDEEGAYYICGAMADRKFEEIDIYNVEAKSKGFILKIDEAGMLSPTALVFTPDNVDDDAKLCVISDIMINDDDTEIAFTGMNSRSSLTGYHHPMSGIIDMDLNIDWCLAYEIESAKYAGVNIVYNDDDTTLFVLHNSQGNEFSVMEVKQSDGSIVQDPMAFKFTDNSTSNDTARAHMMHYFNDTILITGNHFADKTSGLLTENKQFLYRFDINADSLKENFSDMTYYSEQDTPDGHQRASYSYWTPENSVYISNNLHLVGVYNEYGEHFGFKYVKEDSIAESCVDTFDHISSEIHPDDTLSCTGSTSSYTETEVDFDWGNINVIDTLECDQGKSSPLYVGKAPDPENEIWQFKRITPDGIEALLISEKDTKYQLSVYDILGRQVYNAEFNVTDGETTVHMNFEVKPEVYIIKVSDGAESKTRKVINLNH